MQYGIHFGRLVEITASSNNCSPSKFEDRERSISYSLNTN